MVARGAGRQDRPARPHRGGPRGVLPGEPVEHRRGRPARRGRARGRGDPGPRARVAVSGGAGADASPWRRGRDGLGRGPRIPPQPVRGERDPDEPDAGLRRAVPPRLVGAGSLAGPPRLQLPRVRGLRRVACPAHHRRRTRAPRRRLRDRRGGGPVRVHGTHPQGIRDPGERRISSGRRLRRLLAPAHGVVLLRPLGGARGARRDLRGGGAGRAAPAHHLARLRIHRDHRRVPRSAEPHCGAARGHRARHQLPRRRGGPGRAQDLRQDGAGVPGHPAVPHPRLRQRSSGTGSGWEGAARRLRRKHDGDDSTQSRTRRRPFRRKGEAGAASAVRHRAARITRTDQGPGR